jgi:hypothetical protein
VPQAQRDRSGRGPVAGTRAPVARAARATARPTAVRAASAQGAGRRREDRSNGLVELADRGEAGGERDLGEGQAGRLDQQPRGVGALRAGERERPCPQLGDEQPVEVALAVAEARRGSRPAAPPPRSAGSARSPAAA